MKHVINSVRPGQLAILTVLVAAVILFGASYMTTRNFEFMVFIVIMLVITAIFILTNHRVYYPNSVLWAMVVWGILHLAGGCVDVRGARLYELILVPVSEKYNVFRYDQLVHIVGFGATTAVMYSVLRCILREDVRRWSAISVLVIMAGLGLGALNEIVEFLIVQACPEAGVGGYVNTSVDLVADLVGGVGAMVIIRLRAHRMFPAEPGQLSPNQLSA